MRNIRLTIQYEGTRYQGWQRQNSSENTLQGKLEKLLTRMCGEPVTIQASGRTDAGVHAMAQTANFVTSCSMSLAEMLSYMNQYLPEDIAVTEIAEAAPRFHSRLNAVGKRYVYRIWRGRTPDVFWRRYVWEVNGNLDLEAMRQAAGYLCGEHDFKAFTSAKKSKKSTVRRIDEITVEESEGGQLLSIGFTGNGFLHHMVRILTGTLVEIGKGERSPEEIRQLLSDGTREQAGALAPAKGLMLMEVFYQ